ncbi:uncharacterized protein LOC131299485 [Rhododendron vialii]|uniref:uncharacterized protein LOC131299485 n=1 Tax=Rhododendron vialii TaxID=182163 RepID=UPI00265FB6BF|nr:uncharacterized protein LOC131299485 [Rhododendron vialii]
MPIFTATFGSAFLSHRFAGNNNHHSSSFSGTALTNHPPCFNSTPIRRRRYSSSSPRISKVSVSGDAKTQGVEQAAMVTPDTSASPESVITQKGGSADWEAARAYSEKGLLHEGRIDGFNGGGLLVRFYSLVGFLPYPQLSPYHSCKEPNKSIQDIAEALRGSIISVKVIVADQANKKLIFSEKEAMWSKFSGQVNIGDLFEGRVGSIEDYGAFVHLHFPDGSYCLTGLVHISEVSWNLVQDIRDILNVDDEVRVKVISIDREKSRLALSIKQLEEDPLLETLENVIPQDGSADPTFSGASNPYSIEPLPGLETVLDELRQEEGISDVRISRQGFEKRVVSPDLQLWLSNAPPIDKKFTLLARAGREVQMIQLTTSLDQEGIKRALQRALERIP